MASTQTSMEPRIQGIRAASRSWASGLPSRRRGGLGPLKMLTKAT